VPLLKLEVDADAYARLIDRAQAEKRPVPWQAEVELRRALGLPFPVETNRAAAEAVAAQEGAGRGA
jgi:hypothetical protein